MNRASEFRTYERGNAICFRMTSGAFGGLSNMAPGFPLRVNGLHIYTSEALYQACRFPHLPEIQKMIVEQRSPMTAKMRSKPYRRDSRTDWDRIRVKVMRWCLRIKLVQHSCKFKDLLLSTDSRSIVEESQKDDFWGAKPTEHGTLIGTNVLGRLLMELREEVKNGKEIVCVAPLTIPDFLLLRDPILEVYADADIETTDNLGVRKDFRDLRIPSQLPLIPDQSMPPATTRIDRPMNHALQPYSEYKDPGLPWLDCFPRDWRVLRGKSVFSTVDVRSGTGKEELLTVSTSNGVRPRSQQTVTMFMAKSYVGHKLCWPGDIVVNSLWAWMQGLGVAHHHGLISSAYSVYRPHGEFADYSKFFHYLLRSAAYKWELQTRSKGVWTSRLQLLDQAFMDMPIVLPPADEQNAIVRFLDHANRRIERAIQTKKQLIALLYEQKQAIVHRAVTRGLDPDVALTSSGVQSLGDIPRHWEVRRLRTLVHRIEQGVSPLAGGFLAEGDSWGVLKSGCVNGGVFRETEHKQLAKSFKIDPAIVVKVGDVLISRACGSPSLVGSVGRVEALNYRLILSDKTFRAVFRKSVDLDFMVFAMNSRYYRDQVEQAISGAEGMANNLPVSSLRDFVFVIPPGPEAAKIVIYLRERLIGIQKATARAEREIALLHEYQTRLIADVVTGKVDVREASRDLPVTPEEVPVALDDEEIEEEVDG